MTIQLSVFWIILACAAVTVIPRVLPFLVVRNMELPAVVMKWLSFIPVCLFTSLVAGGVLTQGSEGMEVDWHALLAIAPTLAVAVWTRSLALTVLVGMISMGLIRYFF